MTTVLWVALAGAAGVLTRMGVARATAGTDALLWATLGINVLGSFALGVLTGGGWGSRGAREAIGVGFLGGLTTFSTFSMQVVLEAEGGRSLRAGLYVALSVLGGIAAALMGYALGRSLSSG